MAAPTINANAGLITAGGNLGNVNSYNTVYYWHPGQPRVELANWVSDLDFSQYHSQAYERYTEGTLLWVLEEPEFVVWLNDWGILWCPGKPGAGKTVFASFIINHLQNLPWNVKPTVCYIYHRYDTTRTTLQVFEAILKQLILRCPSMNVDRVQAAKNHGQRLTLKEILSILQETFHNVPNIFLVVDAFDECFDESTRHQVLLHLQALTSVSILITSRPLPSIEAAMGMVRKLIISAHGTDIRKHFRAQTKISPTLSNLVPKVSDTDIEGKLVEKADGRFLLAGLHIVNLVAQTNISQLLHALETLPQEVAASYEETLDRIRHQDPNRRQLAFQTLSWVLYALRPLSMTELRYALAIGRLNRMAMEEDLDDENSIVSSCAGLIVLNRSKLWYSDDERVTVNFLHYTVKEFLQQARTAPDFLSEIEIAMHCIKVISYPGIILDPPNYPFIRYAASSWGPLVRQHEGNKELLDLALFQLGEKRTLDILSNTGINHQFLLYSYGYTGQCGVTAIHLIALYGLVRTAKAFIAIHGSASSLINEADSLGRTALIWVARIGHLELVKLLLSQSEIDVNLRSTEDGLSALSHAARNRHLEIVKELIRHPNIDPNSGSPRYVPTPLFYAARNADLGTVQQLLTHPNIDPNLEYGDTALCYAVRNGHEQIVYELLAHTKIDVNQTDVARGRTPLCCAAKNGSLNITKQLVTHPKINVNSKDRQCGQTPLGYAAQNGNTAVVQYLLAHPEVDVNSKDNQRGQTPLGYAAQSGNMAMVQYLLAHPRIDVNSKDNQHGQTPLGYAAQNGNTAMVQYFLAHPKIDVNTKDKWYSRTPLLFATSHGHWDVVWELVAHPDIDVNSRETSVFRRTLLCYAARSGNTTVVQQLLVRPEIDVNAGDVYHQTPLFHAASNGHSAVVRELVAHPNIDVNSRDILFSQTPLCHAAKNGNIAVVKHLLVHPEIDVNTRNDSRQTPLLHAARNGHAQVVQELVAHPNIDVNSEDMLGQTPLCYAARNGNTEAVKHLLSHPQIDVNAKDEEYRRTPLFHAVMNRHYTIVHQLLTHPRIDVSAKDEKYYQTPLFHAVTDGDWAMVQELIAHPRIDVNSRDDGYGLTPLCQAIDCGYLEMVQTLLEHPDIDVNSKDEIYGFAPLPYAVIQGDIAMVYELLIHPKIDVNSRDNECGRASLSYAAEAGNFEIVELLLDIPNIDINSRDTMWGLTPLLWAANDGHILVADLLLDTGKIPLPGNRKISSKLRAPSFPSTSRLPTLKDLPVLQSSSSRSEAPSPAEVPLQNLQPYR